MSEDRQSPTERRAAGARSTVESVSLGYAEVVRLRQQILEAELASQDRSVRRRSLKKLPGADQA